MAAVVVGLSGCIAAQILPYEASIPNEAKLASLPREARLQVKAPGSDPSNVSTVIRALRVTAPGNGSWSAYLGQALHAELAASGHYDASAALVLDASLNELKIADGTGAVTGHFVIRDAQGIRYDKVLHVDARWDSDFFGVIAASNGMNQATAIFQALLQKLFEDPDFIKAVRSA
jgi:hypothetical protein